MNQKNKWIILGFLIASFFAKAVIIPIFLSLFLAMLFDPMVKALTKLKIRRWTASLISVAIIGGVSVLLGWIVYTASVEMLAAIPTYISHANSLMAKLSHIGERLLPVNTLSAKVPVVQLAQTNYPEWTHFVFTTFGTGFEVISTLLFVPLLMFYFLVDKDSLLESFNAINGKYFNLPKLNHELPRMLRVFFAANILTGVFLSVTQTSLFLFAGFENWISLGLLCGLLSLLPVVGGGVAVSAGLLLGIGVEMTIPLALTIGTVVMGLHILGNNLLMPLLFGARLNVNAVALIIGLMFWSWIWGAAGFILAVPMTALIKILLECNKETYLFANLMAAKPQRVLKGRASLFKPVSVEGIG